MSTVSTPSAFAQRDETGDLIESIVRHSDTEAMKFLRGRLIAAAKSKRIPFDLAEEAFQETMLSLSSNPNNFLEADHPNSYIYVVFYRNIARVTKKIKRQAPESTWSIGSAEGLQDYRTVDPSLAAEIAETRERFDSLLPSNLAHRAIIEGRIIHGIPHDEIAKTIDKDPKYVRAMSSKLNRWMLQQLGIVDIESDAND